MKLVSIAIAALLVNANAGAADVNGNYTEEMPAGLVHLIEHSLDRGLVISPRGCDIEYKRCTEKSVTLVFKELEDKSIVIDDGIYSSVIGMAGVDLGGTVYWFNQENTKEVKLSLDIFNIDDKAILIFGGARDMYRRRTM